MPTPPWQPPAEVSGSAPTFSHHGRGQGQRRAALDQDAVQVVVADVGGPVTLDRDPADDDATPVVFAPLFLAPQISTTDCGTWLAVSVAWQLVVDPTGLASPSMVTRPDRGAWKMFRLLVIVTCSW